ncbi:hypothetical protein Syun_003940 [Stephania yunnanensis]|uniref:Protein kinase domain-containing protein n=1 Tax=Stephania yunnanensis TaxID=152371 RepID=A0AAP0L3I0_9MAGN
MSLIDVTTLQVLDLSHNHLAGKVPDNGSFLQFTSISFMDNPGLCGPAAERPCPGDPPFSPSPPILSQPTASSPESKSSSTGDITGGVAAGAALLFSVPAIGFVWRRRRKREEHFFDVPAEEDPEVHLGQLRRFSLCELQVATDSFSYKHILGRGGFGKVYKGRLADDSLVAVKRLKKSTHQVGNSNFRQKLR